MVYKRYIKKGGKVYGPYTYHSRKENGKVVSEYLGKNSGSVKKNNSYSKVFSLILLTVIILFACYSVVFQNSENISVNDFNFGKVSSFVSNSFSKISFVITGFDVEEGSSEPSTSSESSSESSSSDSGASESSSDSASSESESSSSEETSSDSETEATSDQETFTEEKDTEEIVQEENSETSTETDSNSEEIIPVESDPEEEVINETENSEEEVSQNETSEEIPEINETETAEENQTDEIEFPVEENDSTEQELINETEVEEISENQTEIIIENETIIFPINITEQNITINETILNETIINETFVNITGINLTIETIQYSVVLGKPVKWKKKINKNPNESVSVELPKEAMNISVYKIVAEDKEEIEEDILNETTENSEENLESGEKSLMRISITANVISNGDSKFFFSFFSFFKRLAGSLTGRVVSIDEDVDSKEVVIDENATELEIEYETPGPVAFETNTSYGKQIMISSEIHYENVLAYTELETELVEGSFALYWLVNESYEVEENNEIINLTREVRQKMETTNYDLNNNSLIDYIEWVVPHLSNQTFELIIEISKAEHLDSNRTFIEDIYDSVSVLDGNWSPVINDSEYVRVTFETPLDSTRDITIYARGNGSVEVYEEGSDEIIAIFENISEENYYKIYLENLVVEQDVFDLKILGEVEFDYIIDPDSYTKLLLSFDGDKSTSVHNLIYNGNPQLTSDKKIGSSSIFFDGVGDYILIPDSNDWDLSGYFTIDFWYKSSDTDTGDYIFKRQAGSCVDFALQIVSSSEIRFLVENGTNCIFDVINSTSGASLSDNTWHHVAIVKNKIDTDIYIDGVSKMNIQKAYYVDFSSPFELSSSVSAARFYLDEFRISDDIARWTSSFTPPTTEYSVDSKTKLLLHFEGDESSSAHNLTLNGDIYENANGGKFDGAFYFDGSHDYISIPDSDDWDFGSGDFTIDWWEKRISLNDDGETILCRNGTGRGYPIIWQLGGYSGSNDIHFYGTTDGSSWGVDLTLGSPNLNSWTHYALVRSGNNFYGFKNGILQGQDSDTGTFASSSDPLIIGARELISETHYFDGYIDELRVSKGIARWTSNFEVSDYPYDEDPYPIVIKYPVEYAAYVNVTSINYTTNLDQSCWYSTNGGLSNSSSVSAGTNFTNNFADGKYNLTLYCNDSSNNIYQDNLTFIVGDYNYAEEVNKITASDNQSGDRFGFVTSIS